MAGANCPLRLCDQGVTGRGPHPSFRAATRRCGDRQYLIGTGPPDPFVWYGLVWFGGLFGWLVNRFELRGQKQPTDSVKHVCSSSLPVGSFVVGLGTD